MDAWLSSIMGCGVRMAEKRSNTPVTLKAVRAGAGVGCGQKARDLLFWMTSRGASNTAGLSCGAEVLIFYELLWLWHSWGLRGGNLTISAAYGSGHTLLWRNSSKRVCIEKAKGLQAMV
jgi:hypothetical protein